ncbi:MAG: helix-turn-helix domain-containing protein [Rhodospirillaceae bacterium]
MAKITKSRALTLSIGELSKRTGCNIETIRFYEKIGILPSPPRTAGGHRVYGEDHLKRLTFVRRCRDLGFTLDEVRTFLELVDGQDYTCAQIEQITLEHLREVRQKISDLKKLERVLKEMASQCSGGTVPECPIIDALSKI